MLESDAGVEFVQLGGQTAARRLRRGAAGSVVPCGSGVVRGLPPVFCS